MSWSFHIPSLNLHRCKFPKIKGNLRSQFFSINLFGLKVRVIHNQKYCNYLIYKLIVTICYISVYYLNKHFITLVFNVKVIVPLQMHTVPALVNRLRQQGSLCCPKTRNQLINPNLKVVWGLKETWQYSTLSSLFQRQLKITPTRFPCKSSIVVNRLQLFVRAVEMES